MVEQRHLRVYPCVCVPSFQSPTDVGLSQAMFGRNEKEGKGRVRGHIRSQTQGLEAKAGGGKIRRCRSP